MIVVGDALKVFSFCPVADVRVDVPTVAFMLPDAAWHCGAFVLADEVVAATMLGSFTPTSREFSMMRFSECRMELVQILLSVSIFGEANDAI